MKPGMLKRSHTHRHRPCRIEDGEERRSRGLRLSILEYWYEDRCRCGDVDGPPRLGRSKKKMI